MRSSQYSVWHHLLGRVPLVMRGIVDRAVGLARFGHAGAKCGDIGEIDALEMPAKTLVRKLPRQARAFLGLDVEEHDDGSLPCKAAYDRRCPTHRL
jgi:hypothetical protein